MVAYEGPFDFSLIGEEAYNSYRIEQGYPAAPNELNDNYNPHEARLMKFVDANKGCYIGQEVIERINAYDKVQKNLCGVEFNEPLYNEKQFTLIADGSEVGTITSIIHSIRLKTPIGLAYINKNYAVAGKQLTARCDEGREVSVTVKELPFVK